MCISSPPLRSIPEGGTPAPGLQDSQTQDTQPGQVGWAAFISHSYSQPWEEDTAHHVGPHQGQSRQSGRWRGRCHCIHRVGCPRVPRGIVTRLFEWVMHWPGTETHYSGKQAPFLPSASASQRATTHPFSFSLECFLELKVSNNNIHIPWSLTLNDRWMDEHTHMHARSNQTTIALTDVCTPTLAHTHRHI